MRKFFLLGFDLLVYGGFGLFLISRVVEMPPELKSRLLSESWKLISRMTG